MNDKYNILSKDADYLRNQINDLTNTNNKWAKETKTLTNENKNLRMFFFFLIAVTVESTV